MGEAAFGPQMIDLYNSLCSSSLFFHQDTNKFLFKECILVPSVLLRKNGGWGKGVVTGSVGEGNHGGRRSECFGI